MLIIPFIIAFIIRTFRNTLYQTFLWQLKEYRIDRIIAHLRTPQGKKLVFGPITSFKWILLLLISGYILSEYHLLPLPISYIEYIGFYAYLFFGLTWIIESIIYIREFISYGWKIPVFTLKAIIILGGVLLFQLIPLITGNLLQQLWIGPFLDKLLAPAIIVLMILFNLLSSTYKQQLIWKAKRKIAGFKNLIVIGITGSFGKTSTKEFLATILSEKYKVAKTPASNNTDIGIAKYIINELETDDEIFIVEMGAYKRGEIKAICKMVHPKMGIITGINEQHIELFGSLEETKKTKYELMESLPKGAVAIFNGDNTYCLEMAKLAREQGLYVLTYQIAKNINSIKIHKDHLEFDYLTANKKYYFKINILGKQNLGNILAVIYAAQSLKMSIKDVKRGILKVTPPDKTMKLFKSSSGTILIDDTFNANPDGVVSALSYMKLYKGRKILVLTPLIELGEESMNIHQRLGRAAASICDLVLLTNPNFETSFRKGIISGRGDSQKVQMVSKTIAIKIINNIHDKDGVVVFEGKEAGKILDQLVKLD